MTRASPAGTEPRVVAIVQVRMGSTRLPGKSLRPIVGKPLLLHIIDRIRSSRTIHDIVVATTTLPEDRAIVDLCRDHGVQVFTGSAEDVLDRFYRAALEARAQVIVRITGDDPFKDSVLVDRIVRHILDNPELDYVSNTLKPTCPEGLDVEAFTFHALETAWQNAKLRSEREHVTPYIWKNTRKFRIENIECSEDLSGMRWTVDYEEDLKFAEEVYGRLYHGNVFLMEDILALLREHPEIMKLNSGIRRNEGYLKSLKRDRFITLE